MAQYRGRAQEGSFESNQIKVPDQSNALRIEGERQLRGLKTAQEYEKEQYEIYNRAEQAAYESEIKSLKLKHEVDELNRRTQIEAAKNRYDLEIAKLQDDERRSKSNISKVEQFLGIAQAGVGLYTGIVEKNKEIQQKAINEVSFKQGFDIDDIRAAKSVDNNISRSEWQRTQIVQSYIKEGKSTEFINAMYEHLIKGGGYRNYVINGNVLTATATEHAREQRELMNSDLAPEELRQQYDALLTRQRASLYVDGNVAGPKFLEQFYNPTIREQQRKFDVLYNNKVKLATDEDNNVQQNLVIENALKGGESNGWNIEAAFSMANTSTAPGHVRKVTELIIGQATTSKQIEELRKFQVEKDGKRIPIQYLDSDIEGLLDAASDRLYRKEQEADQNFAKVKQLEATNEQLRFLEEKRQEKGFIDDEDVRKSIELADDIYGLGRNKDLDAELQKETVEEQYKPILEMQIQERIENKTLSLSSLMEMKIPGQLRNKYIDMAIKLDKMRNSPEFKKSKKELRNRIEGAIAQNPGVIKFSIEGGEQSDQINWFIADQLKKYHKQYADAVLVGTPNALEVIGNKAALETNEYLNNKANVFGYKILAYDKEMKESYKNSEAVAAKIDAWNRLDGNARKDPNNWITVIGEKNLQVATQELQQKGDSETFKQIGRALGLSQYEVQEKVAEVSENIEPVEMPDTFQEFMKNFTPDEANILQREIFSNERKLDLLRGKFSNEAPPIRSSFQVQQQQAQVQSTNPTQARWEALAQQVGFTPKEAVTMAQIIMAESNGNATIDTVKSGLDPNKTNEYSIGGPQINVAVHQDKLAARGFTEEDMRDPLKSMYLAKDVYDQQGFGAWSTYTSGKYKNFSEASEGSIGPTGALTYKENKETYRTAGKAFADAGFRVGEQSDFDQVDPVHSSNSYHYYDEAFDITHQTGDYNESIAKTGRLQQLIESLDLFKEVIGPLSGDPNHATHLHLGGLKRPMTAKDIRLIKSLK